jgi:hypothetical protein
LHDGGSWNRQRVASRLSRGLSVGSTPASGAAFVEGFLAGSGTVLVHDRELLEVEGWLATPVWTITSGPLATPRSSVSSAPTM